METLKIPVCVTLAIIVWLSCVKAESSIVCNGRDFECEGTKRFLTCVHLPDGQKLFSPNDCPDKTFCNDANPTSQPCNTNPVMLTTDSTSPTSTADPATRLAEPTTLPYIRPTVVPPSAIIANSLTYSKISPNKNSDPGIQDIAATIPDNAPDTIYVDFDVDVSSNSSAFDNNSTLISRIISVENPTVIKTSAVVKLVASNKTAILDSKEQPPKIATNTSIASKGGVKSPRYVISTSMHTLFRSSELTADSVVTVAGGSSNQSSVTVNVDTGIENGSSNDVIVTTNTTVSLGAAGSAFTSTSTSISNKSSDALSALPIADISNHGTALVGDKLDEESSASKTVDSSSNNGNLLESKSDNNAASNTSLIFNETKVSPIPKINLNKENGVYNHSAIEERSNLEITSVSPILPEGQSEVDEISQPLTTEVVKSEQNNEKENSHVVDKDYEPLTKSTEYQTTLSPGQNIDLVTDENQNNDIDDTIKIPIENPSNNVKEVTTNPFLNNIPLSTLTPQNIVVEQTSKDDPEKNDGPTEFQLDGISEIAATTEKELISNEISTLKFLEDPGMPEGVGNSTLGVTASSALNTDEDTLVTKLDNEWSSTPNPIPMKLNTDEAQATLDFTQDNYINLRTSDVRQSVEVGHYLNSSLDEIESTTQPVIAETTITTTSKKDEIETSTITDIVEATTSLNSITSTAILSINDKVQTIVVPDEGNSGIPFFSSALDQTEKDRMDSKLSDINTGQFDEFETTQQSVQTGDSTSPTTTFRQVRHDGEKPKKQSAAPESNLSFTITNTSEKATTDSFTGEISTAMTDNLQKASPTESAIQQDAEKTISTTLGLEHKQVLKSVTEDAEGDYLYFEAEEQFFDVPEIIASHDLDNTSYIETNLPEVISFLRRTTRETTATPVTEAILVKEYRTPAWTAETTTTTLTDIINSEIKTLNKLQPTQTSYFAGLDTKQNSTPNLVHLPSSSSIKPERRVDSVETSTIPSAALEVNEKESESRIQKTIIEDKNSSSNTTNVDKVPEELRSPLENNGDMAVNSNQSQLINTANGVDTIAYEAQKKSLVETSQDLSPTETPVIERVTDISAYILKDRVDLGSSDPPLVNEKSDMGEILKESPVEINQNLRPEPILITEVEAHSPAHALEGAINHNIPVGSSNPSIEEENTTISKVSSVSEKTSTTASLGAEASGNAHTIEETESSHNNTDYATISPNWPSLNNMKSHPSTLETTFHGYKPEAPLGQNTENKAAYPAKVLQTNSEVGKSNEPGTDTVLTVAALDGSKLNSPLSEPIPEVTQTKGVVSEMPEPSLVVVEEIGSVGISEPKELQGKEVVEVNAETLAMVEQEVNSSGNRTSGNRTSGIDHESIIAAADFSNSQNNLEEDLKMNESNSKKLSKSETSNKSQTKLNQGKTREGKSIGFGLKPNSTFPMEEVPSVPLTPGFDLFLSNSSNRELTTTETIATEVLEDHTPIPASIAVSEGVEIVQHEAGDIVSSPLPGNAENSNRDEVNNGLADTKIGIESTLTPEVTLGQNLQPESNAEVSTAQASPSTTIDTTVSSARELAVETNEVQQTTPSSLESATKLPEIGVKEGTEPESFTEGTQKSTILIRTTSTEPTVEGALTSGPISVPAEQVALATVSSNTKEMFMCTAHGVFPDKNNCRQYYLCVQQAPGYVKIRGLCPPRFAFSFDAQRCVRDVSSCYESKCDMEGNYPDPMDDSSYFWCTENSTGVFHKYHLQCDYPMKFIPSTGICDDPKKLEEVSFVERTTQVEATTENIASNTVEFETTQSTSEGYLDEIPTTVLIELEYREMAVATNKYETAFIESFPMDEKHHIATSVRSSNSSNVQESATEESLIRTARHAGQKKKPVFKCSAHGSFAHPNDCTKYFICFRRGRTGFAQINGTCPSRNAFDPETRSCGRDLAVCPDLQCEEPGNFAHPYEQTSYFRCIYNSTGGFQKYHIKCPPRMKYYPLLDVCSDGRKMHLARTLTPEQIEVFESGVQTIDPQLESPKESPKKPRKDSDEESDGVVDENKRLKLEKRLRKILERMRNEAYEREEASERRRREHEKDVLKRRGQLHFEEDGGKVGHKGKAIEEFRCNDLGYFPDSKNCQRYYVCTIKKDKLKKHHMYCDESLRFDSRRRICVNADEARCA